MLSYFSSVGIRDIDVSHFLVEKNNDTFSHFSSTLSRKTVYGKGSQTADRGVKEGGIIHEVFLTSKEGS